MAEMVKLKSSQGDLFVVEKEVAMMSNLLKNMIEDTGSDEEIPLPNVKSGVLQKVGYGRVLHRSDAPSEQCSIGVEEGGCCWAAEKVFFVGIIML